MSRPRKTSCSWLPTVIGPIASDIPNCVTIRRAISVARSMSLPAPVVIFSGPKTISSATRPPKSMRSWPSSQPRV